MFKKLFLVLLFVTTVFQTTLSANTLAPTEESVAELYIAYFERAADSLGLKYWLSTGLSIEDIARSFFDQDETKERYPEGYSNEDFVTEVYANLFNREPDALGYGYWLIELDAGRVSRDVFILAVINGARGTDAMILDNKTEVGLAFAHDGRSDYDESIEILEDVTEDHQTVVDTLCEYDLGPCPIKDPPTADAGPDQMVGVALNTLVTLDGSASKDSNSSTYPETNARAYADDDPLTYKWTMTIKPAGSNATLSGETTINPTFTPDKFGGYVIELVVNNGAADSPVDSVTVTPDGSNVPIANAGANQNDVPVGKTVTVDGSASIAPEGRTLTYKWTISLPAGSSATLSDDTAVRPTFIADTYGSYGLKLIVNDGTMDSVPSSVSVGTVENVTSVANAGPDQDGVLVDVLITLDGSGSQDPNGDSLTYKWTMTSKPAESIATLSVDDIANPAFTTDKYGIYTIDLVVYDGSTYSDPDTVTVTTIDDPRIIWPGNGDPNGKEYLIVVSPITGESWLDRNMGADQACTSSDDAGCYGDYYQWGRATDGHEISTSDITNSQVSEVTNVGNQFISASTDWTTSDEGGDERSANWSKTDGSSICPPGFKVPIKSELAAETTDAGVSNTTTAFENFLKIPASGSRSNTGAMQNDGAASYLWSSSSESDGASGLSIDGGSASWNKGLRSSGASVRCMMKD